jgi:hypothetical protein
MNAYILVQRSAVKIGLMLGRALALLTLSVGPTQAQTSPSTPSWFTAGVTAAFLDTREVSAESLLLPRAPDALVGVTNAELKKHPEIVDTLIAHLEKAKEIKVRAAAGQTLTKLNTSSREDRKTINAALIKQLLLTGNDSDPFGTVFNAIATALPDLQIDDPEQRRAAVQAIQAQALRNDIAIDALGRLRIDDHEQRTSVIEAITYAIQDGNSYQTRTGRAPDVRAAGAIALGRLCKSDGSQIANALPVLTGLLGDASVNDVYVATIEALGLIDAYTGEQLSEATRALLGFIERDRTDGSIIAAAKVIEKLNPGDEKIRVKAVSILTKRLQQSEMFVAKALNSLRPDTSQRGEIWSSVVKRFDEIEDDIRDSKNTDIQIALSQAVSEFDWKQQDLGRILTGLASVLKSSDRGAALAAATSLAKLARGNSIEQQAAITAIAGQIGTDSNFDRLSENESIVSTAVETLGQLALTQTELTRQIAEILLRRLLIITKPVHDLKGNRLEYHEPVGSEQLTKALILLPLNSTEKSKAIDLLLELASQDNPSKARFLNAIARLHPESTAQRETFFNVLLKNQSRETIPILAQLEPDTKQQRDTIVSTLLDNSRNLVFLGIIEDALINFGPLRVEELIVLLKAMSEDRPLNYPAWRARAIALSGQTSSPEAAWVFTHFLAHPDASTIPWKMVDGNPTNTVAYLSHIAGSWTSIKGAPVLESEIAARIVEMVGRACPLSLQDADEQPLIFKLIATLKQEAAGTISWIVAIFSNSDHSRCWTKSERRVLASLLGDMRENDNLKTFARSLTAQLEAEQKTPSIGLALAGYILWGIPSLLLIAAFPHSPRVRLLYLYNSTARGLLSLGWIPVLILISPFLRKRMLQPFRDALLADAKLEDFDPVHWYPFTKVRDESGEIRTLAQAIPEIRGNLILVGESGLGKSTYLRLMVMRVKGPIAFLNARSCDGGVLAAIERAIKESQNIQFLSLMLESGDLTVIVDGLNEVSADIRAGIIEFVGRFPTANVLIATQPIEAIPNARSTFGNACSYELLPLEEDQIEEFLLSRSGRSSLGEVPVGTAYAEAVRRFIYTHLQNAPTSEERDAARLLLSNPMDLTYASELLALGEIPHPKDLLGQAFQLGCREYAEYTKREFPKIAFARKVVALRLQDRNWLDPEEFANEQPILQKYRLMIARSRRSSEGDEIVGVLFRHEKVMDFFMQIAFADSSQLQIKYLEDPKFRGVYLLFAQTADLETARRLRDLIVVRAAHNLDHSLSDEFVRRLSVRDSV